jgi:cleavage and polyadenylation specificity factor subunit 1
VARALFTGWIFRFGCPQNRDVSLSHGSSTPWPNSVAFLIIGVCILLRVILLSRITAYHPAANGFVERFHRTLKAAILCHADQHWIEALPLVLFGICTSFKADLGASSAGLVYGEQFRIPGEPLNATAHPVEPHSCSSTSLASDQSRQHATPVQVHLCTRTCTGVFLHQDATRRALETPYTGPYKVLSRREKTLQLIVRGKPVTVSTDRVNPAYIFNEVDFRNTVCSHAMIRHIITASSYSNYAFRSPRPLPRMLQHLSNHLPGGRCGNLPHEWQLVDVRYFETTRWFLVSGNAQTQRYRSDHNNRKKLWFLLCPTQHYN